MSSVSKLFKLALEHRGEIKSAYEKNGTNYQAQAKDATNVGYDLGTKAVTAPLRAWENIPRLVVRGLQFLFGIIIVGIYGVRVGDGQKNADDASPVWWFGMIVAVLACISALILAFTAPFGAVSKKFKVHYLFGWDLGLCFLWIVVFGIFMQIFHNRSSDDSYQGSSTSVQKAAAWLDLVNVLLWLISGVYGGIKTWVARRRDALKDKAQNKLFQGPGSTSEEEDKEALYAHSVSEPEPIYYHQSRMQGYGAF
ncbi:hypothetical protein N0V82_000968 [Gnomoniopsis sp. IMI 355080]|nr:hypothetical protein N0V82_000968 [Gnomoniopsis sp. IMI 355080]